MTKILLPPDAVASILNPPALTEMSAVDDAFYRERYLSGDAFSWYNRMLLRELPKLPPPESFHEIGGGCGILSLALGLMGYRTLNIDHWEPRIASGLAIIDRLHSRFPDLQERVQMLFGAFPKAVDRAGIRCQQAYAITTNFAGTHTTEAMSEEELKRFLRSVRDHYAGYVFDACLLGGNWRENNAWLGIVNLVRRVFGSEPVLLHARRETYARYYFVRPKRETPTPDEQ